MFACVGVNILFSLFVCVLFMRSNPLCASSTSPPTYVGTGGESNRDEAGCVSSCH